MSEKILVVDNKPDDLKTMKSILAKEGFKTIEATNGAEALDRLKDDGFSLIMLDIKMPTLSGYDTLRLMKERVDDMVPFVFVSIVPKQEADLSGVSGFIQKPFSTTEFSKTVKSVIRSFKAPRKKK